ncbi:MAG: hypothetical protein KJN64_12955 [Ignavibacteria bacterium]|nr:hypothetical protein [Ignavibacteria bacterium]MBT8383286.1 hypothetical protein [Ignavibacteria bacterium]MBT8391450.1 hypothetical protein [Ignavibacteria bacterium]NNL21679.1 hypothetical protein [Ignavibacteriaceae bacterium]
MTTFSKKLGQIINNKKLGSSELVRKLNELFWSYRKNKQFIEKSIPVIKKELKHFTVVENYIKELNSIISSKNEEKLNKFLGNYSKIEIDKYEKIFSKLIEQIPRASNVITISRSGTVLNVLKLWYGKNKKLKVTVCESRPKYEGKFFAQDLIKNRIKVEFITDAMMGLFMQKVDAAIVGADSVLKNGNVINKTGSKSLALLCKEYKKPFYVVTIRSKYSNKKMFKHQKENPAEVWQKKHKNLNVQNIYFEEIEKKFITKIVTD